MTQEFIPSTVTVREMFAHGDSASYEDSVAAFDRWLAAHDAQIRAEALELTNEELDVAARAAFDSRDDAYDLDEWEDADSDDRERYQCYVRPAFSAVAKHRKAVTA
ncbi:hypothetical protein [Bifidobacterium crudilactis]|uniref:hypothetical protein n=1 Tax=Bifidobacterium crudilactis TaxID=327277 RepID=UPI002647CEA0|nr:hypothetical protein [Bifidobacterium crudilactis]MDN5973440.1 hypothetical protein [Bifidobacterium crudilactis]MDN6001799.1 hypothetical protein [Bifidobacterium crudilactis]MDN6210489.1 hypothetical protein [Bifidobacterium crudilactis]MDN6234812.1 hypothetical protein [Bifidobacterium crudilactis]MDN6459308.1 hypothetical protein [Bifidobacterium crudilactis]